MIKALLTGVLALLFMSAAAEGANWLYFIEDDKGDKFYIDIDSIQRVSPDTVRVSRKIEHKPSSKIVSLVGDVEMDCKLNRIRILKETANYKNGKSGTVKGHSNFKKVTTADIEEALLELVCSLKKRT